MDRTRILESTLDIDTMSKKITQHAMSTGALPSALADVGYAAKADPWGNPYEYLNLRTLMGNGKARKDQKLAPLNSDFDLYSIGRDRATAASLGNKASRDDVVRARDGRFIGLAQDFDP